MDVMELTRELGYEDSRNFLRADGEEFATAPAFGHIFRRARERLGLKGVYTLRDPRASAAPQMVPVVYICEAVDDQRADEIHKLVWNQDVAPFLLVATPSSIRLYSGFSSPKRRGSAVDGAPGLLKIFNEASAITDLKAKSIDTGAIWRSPLGKRVNPKERVDWKLLGNLRQLGNWLQQQGELKSEVAHALIGKYVYLHYLKDRAILSDRKLDSWGISRDSVFGRGATLAGFHDVTTKLDDWLNGSVFPITAQAGNTPQQKHLRRVAAIFSGDEPRGEEEAQLHLDFQAYDFSYIPIETLSVVYEQFLHEPRADGKSKGKDAGAYYTPIPLVNFLLAEMNDRHPLRRGMRVLDPSCGSGAFLVQCYRRLIEQSIATGEKPGFLELRRLLVDHVFGVDRDADACGVTELSLILTLLDYVSPPDLEDDKRVKLPTLRNTNIFCSDLFDPAISESVALQKGFDWVVGNPPWKKPENQDEDHHAIAWMENAEKGVSPIGGKQLAQAFAWRLNKFLKPRGEVGLLMPAMTLFDTLSADFRRKFFARFRVHSIANFSNLAEVLFAGRSRVPAAAIFFTNCEADADTEDRHISTYNPLVANQEVTRPLADRQRIDSWSLTLNASEIRSVPLSHALSGDGLPWKIAAWGSHLDQRLFARLERKKFPSVRDLETQGLIIIAQGPEFRDDNSERGRTFDRCEEAYGRPILNMNALKGHRHFFTVPPHAVVENSRPYIRSGLENGLRVCRPPHIIVSEARTFALFSNEFLIVPPRQVGIAGEAGDEAFLKALSLYLNSDFAFYHQFFLSTHFGVQRAIAGLADLRKLPVPVAALSRRELAEWDNLHNRVAAAYGKNYETRKPPQNMLFKRATHTGRESEMETLLTEINERTYEALRLSEGERQLVHDFVHVRYALNDGKVGKAAVGLPSQIELRGYAKRLKADLDAFVGDLSVGRHQVDVVHEQTSAMVCLDFVKGGQNAQTIRVVPAGADMEKQLLEARQRLRKENAQWVYFDRNLMIFEGTRTYLLKPMQRFHWTETQAMLDAEEIISRTLVGGGEPA